MTYEEWASSLPTQFKDDALWRIEAYRLGLFIGDIGWHDDADHPLAHHHDPPAAPKTLKEIPVEYQPGNTQQEIPF